MPRGRVEKTREQREHARGTLRDLPRNTQAQKQRIILTSGKNGLTIDTTNEYDRNKTNGCKKKAQKICTIGISLCQILSNHCLLPGT